MSYHWTPSQKTLFHDFLSNNHCLRAVDWLFLQLSPYCASTGWSSSELLSPSLTSKRFDVYCEEGAKRERDRGREGGGNNYCPSSLFYPFQRAGWLAEESLDFLNLKWKRSSDRRSQDSIHIWLRGWGFSTCTYSELFQSTPRQHLYAVIKLQL